MQPGLKELFLLNCCVTMIICFIMHISLFSFVFLLRSAKYNMSDVDFVSRFSCVLLDVIAANRVHVATADDDFLQTLSTVSRWLYKTVRGTDCYRKSTMSVWGDRKFTASACVVVSVCLAVSLALLLYSFCCASWILDADCVSSSYTLASCYYSKVLDSN